MNSEKFKRCIFMVVAVLFAVLPATAENVSADSNGVLESVLSALLGNKAKYADISFDYSLDYSTSAEYRSIRRAKAQTNTPEDSPEQAPPEDPTIEGFVRAGSVVFEGDKLKIDSKIITTSDGEIFQDEIAAYDGAVFREYDFLNNSGSISSNMSHRESDLTWDIRNFCLLFMDGEDLYDVLSRSDTNAVFMGTEQIDGETCWVVEITRDAEIYIGSQLQQAQVRRKCWLAIEKDCLLKKAIAYKTRYPDRVIHSTTDCELTEISKGKWYYKGITFKSYPLNRPEPDVVMVLELDNIKIDEPVDANNFVVKFAPGTVINDDINKTTYRAGSGSKEEMANRLDEVVDKTLEIIESEP